MVAPVHPASHSRANSEDDHNDSSEDDEEGDSGDKRRVSNDASDG